MRKTILLSAALMLAGCMAEQPPNEYPPESTAPAPRPMHMTQQYPNAAAGVAPKPRPEEAAKDKVKPLGEGMLTALTVGNYMDDQEKDLRAKLRGSGVTISRTGDNLVLNIRSDSLFSGKSMTLSGEGEQIVRSVADDVRRFDSTTLAVNGFTDTTGTADRNMKVSQQRAEAVDKALVDEGVDSHRIAAKGFGGDYLKVPTGPNVNEPRNRRIEIDIAPRVKT